VDVNLLSPQDDKFYEQFNSLPLLLNEKFLIVASGTESSGDVLTR
jgi:hypothetical protein